METLITVFTPTYNREKHLTDCYNSLVNQTSQNFIWQIIDDGSTDGTEELVQKFVEEGRIRIHYKKKPNGGKASTINLSLEITDTPLWVTLDSDDYFLDNAIETIAKHYKIIENQDDVCGMFGLRANPDGTPMQNKNIPESIDYTTQSQVRYDLGIPPEYIHVYKTEIARNYKYPIINGEKYMPLSYVFDQIDQKYKYKVLHEPLMVCEYQSDGITKNKRKLVIKNPIGYKLYKRQSMHLAPNLKEKIKAAITYNSACIIGGYKGCISESPYKLLTIATFPLGLLEYILRYAKVK